MLTALEILHLSCLPPFRHLSAVAAKLRRVDVHGAIAFSLGTMKLEDRAAFYTISAAFNFSPEALAIEIERQDVLSEKRHLSRQRQHKASWSIHDLVEYRRNHKYVPWGVVRAFHRHRRFNLPINPPIGPT